MGGWHSGAMMNRKLIQESEAGESEESEGGDLVAISNSPVPEGAGMIQIGILLRGWNLQKLSYTPLPSPSRRVWRTPVGDTGISL